MKIYVGYEGYWDTTEITIAFKTKEDAEKWKEKGSDYTGWYRDIEEVELH